MVIVNVKVLLPPTVTVPKSRDAGFGLIESDAPGGLFGGCPFCTAAVLPHPVEISNANASAVTTAQMRISLPFKLTSCPSLIRWSSACKIFRITKKTALGAEINGEIQLFTRAGFITCIR